MNEPARDDEPVAPPSEGTEGEADRPESPEAVEVALVVSASASQVIDTIGESTASIEPPAVVEFGAGTAGPAEGPSAAVLEAIERLNTRIDRLQAVVDRELRAESSREKVVDRLHAELQEYKNDLLLKVTKPIFIDLIQLHDDVGKMAEAIGEDRAARSLRDVQQGIEDILYRQGVEPFRVEGDAFDPRRQRAVSTVSTEDPERNKRIAARLRPGFAAGEKVIRPELVSVFSWKRPAPEADRPEPEAGW